MESSNPAGGVNPAGRDTDLRTAVQDIQAGYWMQMRHVLARTGNWPQWTSRTQVLGVVAAQANVVELWLKEEPESLAARVMYARVATERVLQAHRRDWARDYRKAQDLDTLVARARDACRQASDGNPDDAVPWICRLALAEADSAGRYPEHHVTPPPHEYLLPAGPWGLLSEVHRRDPFNREAWHRMSQALQARPGPAGRQAVATDFARWTVSFAPPDSPLLLLPLYARVQEHRERRDNGGAVMLNLLWTREDTTRAITQAFEGWFRKQEPATSSQLDLNYLAYALARGGFAAWAAEVFTAIGDFATPAPWLYDPRVPAAEWRKAFEEDRIACLRSHPRQTGGHQP